jgi:putative transposase
MYIKTFRRKHLGHDDTPYPYTWDSHFSITVCALPRGENHLCHDRLGNGILSSAAYYRALQKWDVVLLLLMPDHLHLVMTPCLGYSLTQVMVSWKRYLAREYKLCLQRDFFDHRLRNTENFNAHCEYILWNPVRAGLVEKPQDWPWIYRGWVGQREER